MATNLGIRAVENPLDMGQLGQDPLVTALVLGQPAASSYPGQQILRPITVPNVTFSYTTISNDHLRYYDAERALRANIRHSDWSVSVQAASLVRHSWRVMKDVAELDNANPSLRMRELSALLAKRIVDMNIETKIRDLISTAGNYPAAHRTAIGAGSEWNSVNGDSRTTILAMADQICADTGLMWSDLSVFLSRESYQAALSDPTFLAARSYQNTAMANAEILAQYWGVKNVWVANPVQADNEGVVSPMYSDLAVIYYGGDAANFDTTYGDLTFGVTFKWNRGVAGSPWFEEENTTWNFPWEDWALPKIINSSCGAIITNCAA